MTTSPDNDATPPQTETKEACNLASSPNLLDLSKLRLTQNFGDSVGVKKLLNTVPVRKPLKTEFFRVHPDSNRSINFGFIEIKEESQLFLVSDSLQGELAQDMVAKTIYQCTTRNGVSFLYPVKLPDEEGRLDSWNQSAREAVDIAKDAWIRLVSNRHLGAYEILQATGALSEPDWPSQSFEELLTIAFKGRIIETIDHPVIRKLRGEI